MQKRLLRMLVLGGWAIAATAWACSSDEVGAGQPPNASPAQTPDGDATTCVDECKVNYFSNTELQSCDYFCGHEQQAGAERWPCANVPGQGCACWNTGSPSCTPDTAPRRPCSTLNCMVTDDTSCDDWCKSGVLSGSMRMCLAPQNNNHCVCANDGPTCSPGGLPCGGLTCMVTNTTNCDEWCKGVAAGSLSNCLAPYEQQHCSCEPAGAGCSPGTVPCSILSCMIAADTTCDDWCKSGVRSGSVRNCLAPDDEYHCDCAQDAPACSPGNLPCTGLSCMPDSVPYESCEFWCGNVGVGLSSGCGPPYSDKTCNCVQKPGGVKGIATGTCG